MALIKFNIRNQIIMRGDAFKVVSDSRNYLHAKFDFLTDEWEGKTATAIFRNASDAYEVVLDQEDTCLVPWEVLQKDAGDFKVSVFAGDLITANTAKVQVYESGYSDDLESSTPPTPSVYAQIIERMDGVEDIVIEKTALAEEYAEQAEGSAASAAESAAAATQKAVEAAQSAETASDAAETAESAKTAAVEAAGASQTASQTAVNAAGNASASELSAAQSAQSASENARTASNASQVASTKADEASQSASRAAASASEASTSATHAAGAATSASGYASDANASATAAAGSAQTASTKATQASASASSAEASANTASTANANAQAAKTAAETAQGAAEDAQEAAETARDAIQDSAAQIAQNTSDIDFLKEDLDALIEAFSVKKYGVSGVGQSANDLTRILDAVGMVAEVGTDGDNSTVRNDFDSAAPWKWRKCVGHWTKGEDRGIFHVHAYQGDDDYSEDGTNGDYVAVECPISYYKMDGDQLIISAHQHEGFRPFDIFCHNHNPQDTIPYYYRPAYALALKDGKAVSLPGLDNCQGAYKTIMNDARTYDGGALGGLAITYPMALSFYDWAMFTVEFAAQNCQSVMQGCAGLRHNADDRLTFKDVTHALVSNWQAARVVGEYIAIVPTNVDINTWTVLATHKITGVTRCNADGTASASGTYALLELADLGKAYYEYDMTGGTEYRICGRPYRTGECNSVSTPSGSPVSNTDSYHPMKYRWVENLYSNQYKTVADFFNKRVGTDDSDYYLEHYYLLRPQDYAPSSTSKPDATDLATDDFVKILETPHENYVNGYVKSRKYSDEYPDIWIPGETTGASASTFFADYAYLVSSYAVRSVRLSGYWTLAASAGLSYFSGHSAPSSALANFGGGLCIIQ